MTLIAEVFPKLRTPKNIVRSMPKNSRFRGSVQKEDGKCTQTIFKIEGQLLYHIDWSLWRQLFYKKCLLLICRISTLFPNTLREDGKYSLVDRDDLKQPIQMQLSPKQNTFFHFFSLFLKVRFNLENFQKKWFS